MSPRVTYIVSAFNRPERLPCVLWSLKVQTDPDFEVIVADNARTSELQEAHFEIVSSLADPRFRHHNTAFYPTPAWDCYWSAEWLFAQGQAKGDWICLPSDDSYYVPVFQEAMLTKARADSLSLVHCDMLYDRRIGKKYQVFKTAPVPRFIDKTGFLLAREAWIGFPAKPQTPSPSYCDGLMIEELVRRGIRHGHVDEVLCVHN